MSNTKIRVYTHRHEIIYDASFLNQPVLIRAFRHIFNCGKDGIILIYTSPNDQ